MKLRVSAGELTVGSFLMSTAHGAGLMLFPVLVGLAEGAAGHEHAGEQIRAPHW